MQGAVYSSSVEKVRSSNLFSYGEDRKPTSIEEHILLSAISSPFSMAFRDLEVSNTDEDLCDEDRAAC